MGPFVLPTENLPALLPVGVFPAEYTNRLTANDVRPRAPG
jgi:hypothetical protein